MPVTISIVGVFCHAARYDHVRTARRVLREAEVADAALVANCLEALHPRLIEADGLDDEVRTDPIGVFEHRIDEALRGHLDHDVGAELLRDPRRRAARSAMMTFSNPARRASCTKNSPADPAPQIATVFPSADIVEGQ